MKAALIRDDSGQDCSHFAAPLIGKGYRVVGTSRDAQDSNLSNLKRLGNRQRVKAASMALNDFRSALQVLDRITPHEIDHPGGHRSVGPALTRGRRARRGMLRQLTR